MSITHDGERFYIDGEPANAVQAHRVLAEGGMGYRERVACLTRLRAGAALPCGHAALYVRAAELAGLIAQIRAAVAVGDLREVRVLLAEHAPE